MTDGKAEYRFLPWVRSGYRPSTPDPLSGEVDDPSQFTLRLTAEAEAVDGTAAPPAEETVDVRMYGPGDVLGFDHRQVVRVEPEPDTPDFTPNYFPLLELDRPDLPWLFSPAAATTDGKLRPWMCLVVVRKVPGVTLTTATEREVPVLEIGGDANPADELPDLTESWAWVHGQVVGGPTDSGAETQWVTDELGGNSTRTVARLVAPRRLEPGANYYACVVPTFEPGRRAGLGLDPFPEPEDGNGDARSVAPAWDNTAMPTSIRLPVYFSWEFATGPAGDFEALVRRLDPEVLASVGFRPVDASRPGPSGVDDYRPVDVRLEGALRSVGLTGVAYPSANRERLATYLGQIDEGSASEPPTFGPPVYGGRHAGVPEVPDTPIDADPVPWLRELNVDPRHRISAGFGTQVIQREQEALMQSAWAQVGDVRRANQLLRRGQLAREASGHVFDDLTASTMSTADLLAVTSPMHRRVQADLGGAEQTIITHVDASRVPTGALSLAFRRVTRPGGPLGTRVSDGSDPFAPDVVVGTFNRERAPGTPPGESDPFLVESESALDGAVAVEESTAPQPEVDRYCSDLGTRLGRTQTSWPPSWGKPIAPDAFIDGMQGVCRAARRSIERLRSHLPPDGAEAVDAVLDRLEPICDDVCLPEDGLVATYERAVGAGAPREQIDVLADLIAAFDDAQSAVADLAYLLDESDLPLGDRRQELQSAFERLRSDCEEMESLLRDRAYDHVHEDACAIGMDLLDTVDGGLDGGETKGSLTELSTICELLCGDDEDTQPGVLAELHVWVTSSGTYAHDLSTRLFRELQRLLGLAEGRVDRLVDRHGQGPAADELRGLATFCEDLQMLVDFVAEGVGAPRDPVGVRIHSLVCEGRPPFAPANPGTQLGDPALANPLAPLEDALAESLDPAATVEARFTARLSGIDLSGREDALDPIMAAPEFPQPMYVSLRDLDEDHLLPGVGNVPNDTLGIVETNPAFVEAYMVGLNHEFARELHWREYPTDRRGTYFDQFWDKRGAVPPVTGDAAADIEPVHEWPVGTGATPLGGNGPDEAATSQAVLLVRGELLRRYPNTIVYAVEAVSDGDGGRKPKITDADAAPAPGTDGVEYPIFRGRIEPDVTFFGFDRTATELKGSEDGPNLGYFVVIEEPPGEPRFGLDVPAEDGTSTDDFEWDDLTWGHVAPGGDPEEISYVPVPAAGPPGVPSPPTAPFEWAKNGAHLAGITWQNPFRIAIHADDMLPEDVGGGS